MRVPSPLSSLLLLPALGACVMGPDFEQAPAPPVSMGDAFARAGEVPASATPRLASWWQGLDDPVLDKLIARALASSPSLEIAEARVRQARSQVRGARAALAPVVGAGAGAGEIRAPALVTGGEARSSSLFVAGFDALWEIDIFGGQRRGVEAAQGQYDASRADAEDARLSLTAEVARRYLAMRAAQHRLGLAHRALVNSQEIGRLTMQLEGAGKVSRIEREQADRGVEAKRQAVAALEAEQNDQKDALAVLVGEAPGALDAMLDPTGAIPLPPTEIAVGDPSAMLARRPDIRAAEQRLRAANAGIGMAEAARMPRIGLAGVIGLGGPMKGDMASADNLFSLAGPTLQWNVADFGRGAAGVDKARAGRDEADAGYRAAVLAALQDAESSLNRYGEARKGFGAATRSALSAGVSADLADQSWRAGRSSALVALSARNEQLGADDARIQAQVGLVGQFVALQKSLAMGVN
ncbi:efflux transporter outer membrane subunit [Sphingobium fuliginis]|nr:efflux transporter outer membrane subunit [Sphingobium fuliginis]